MHTKHKKTFKKIFKNPIQSGIVWKAYLIAKESGQSLNDYVIDAISQSLPKKKFFRKEKSLTRNKTNKKQVKK